MDARQVEEIVSGFLVDELEIDRDKITPESDLREDMGIDSLEVVDMVVLVEQNFGLKMRPEDFKTVRTFGALCKYISEKTA